MAPILHLGVSLWYLFGTNLCRVRAQPCQLCIDGTTPPLLNNPIFDESTGTNVTCLDAVDYATSLDSVSDAHACRQIQDVGLSNCGCTTPENLKTGCTLCPGGNDLLPDPNREIIPFTTCGGIAKVIERFGENECSAYQKVIGDFCGCPDPNPNRDEICRICGDREFVDIPAAAVRLSSIGLDEVPCAFFETIVNDRDFSDISMCKTFQLQAPTCCEVTSEPPPAPDNLTDICAADVIGLTMDKYVECASACIVSACCDPDHPNSCSSTFQSECSGYAPCAVIDRDFFPGLTASPDNQSSMLPDDKAADDSSAGHAVVMNRFWVSIFFVWFFV